MTKKIKILIAEDEAIIVQCLKMELELHGYEVCNFVAEGEEAIEIAKEEKPDIILMDIHLSGKMDGIEAARQIVALKDIPIIFMTGFNDTNIHKKAQDINPVAYLEKPIEVYDVTPIIESVFK
ncbi:MAG: response regulator [Candidatus Cloacimonadota bacterium]|nr:MAG: response regulator [Candidatus Cloacimonadota bacterium]